MHTKKASNPNKLIVYLQGTTPVPEPFFNVEIKEGRYNYETYFPSDYELLDEDYAFAIIGYVGIAAFKNEASDLEHYHKYNSLDYRVFQADTVINSINTNILKKLNAIIVYGHSEGAPVAAKLATINKKITHLGFWGGNALPDYYDFMLFDSKMYWSNKIDENELYSTILKRIESFENVAKDSLNIIPENTDELTEYTNKRWWSYSEPPINHLLKIDIPIYVEVATNDESATIESAYLIPLEFIRLKKQNLTFNVCIGCDHGFSKKINNIEISLWSDIFIDFINWTEKK